MITTITKLAACYFGIVFAAGFALGVVRVMWVEPLLGARTAELTELPFMVAVSYFAARYAVSGAGRPLTSRQAGLIGGLALAMLLVLELTVVLALRGLSLADYLAARDPVSGAAYLFSLVLFCLMPLLITKIGRPYTD